MWGNHGNRKEGQGCEKAWGVVLTWAKKNNTSNKSSTSRAHFNPKTNHEHIVASCV
jgi:hypothetical protein